MFIASHFQNTLINECIVFNLRRGRVFDRLHIKTLCAGEGKLTVVA